MTPVFLYSTLIFVAVQLSTTFYPAFKSASLEVINQELSKEEYQEPTTIQIKAYKGALLMKKSGYTKGIEDKIKFFKEGHELLEGAIETNPDNIEYRFIRLIIQEHAPKILNYNKEIEVDATLIEQKYSSLSDGLKKRIKEYASTNSVALNVENLK